MTDDIARGRKPKGRIILARDLQENSQYWVVAYRKAVAEFKDASAELIRQKSILKHFLREIVRSPGNVCFDRVSGEPEPPLRDLVTGEPWKADDFPTPESLQSVLRRRLLARMELQRVWNELPAAVRQRFPPPPK